MNRLALHTLLQVLCLGLTYSGSVLSNRDPRTELLNIRRIIGIGAYDQALEWAVSSLELRSANTALYDLIIESAQYASRLAEVDSFLRSRIFEGKDVPLALYARGQVFLKRGDWVQALRMFGDALDYGLNVPSLHAASEYAYEKAYGVEKAVDHFLALSHRDPNNPGVWYSLALAYWSLPDPENSISAISEALAISPEEPRFRQLRIGARCSWSLTPEARQAAIREVNIALAAGDVEGAEFVRWCVIDALYTIGEWDSAMSVVEQAYTSVSEFGQLKWRAHLHLALARSHFSLGLTHRALQHADSASKYFSVVDEIDGCLSSRALKIGILRESGALREAVQNCFRMFSELSSGSDARLWGGAFIDASWTMSELGAFKIALAMGIEAQRILQKCSYAVYDQIRMNTALGLVHQRSGNIDLALRYQRIALELSEHASVSRNSIATCEGKLAMSLLLQGDTLEALGHLKRQLLIARETKDPGEEKEALLVLGEIAMMRRQNGAATVELRSSLKIAKNQNDDRTMQRCYLALGRVAENEGDVEQAKDYYNRLAGCLHDQRKDRYHMLITEETRDWYLAQHGDLVHALCRTGQPAVALAVIEVARKDISYELFCHSSRVRRDGAVKGAGSTIHLGDLLAEKRRAIGESLESNDVVWSRLLPLMGQFWSIADTLTSLRDDERRIEMQAGLRSVDLNMLSFVREHIVKEEDILLEFWVGKSVTERFAVTSDTLTHMSLKMNKDRLKALVKQALEISNAPTPTGAGGGPSQLPAPAESADSLSNVLLGGLDDLLTGKRRLRVVGDEPVIDMTFDVLTWGAPDQRSRLVTQFSISYASTIFLFNSTSLVSSSLPFRILVLANPLGPARSSNAATLVSSLRSGTRHGVYRLGLPSAQREAEVIRSLFGLASEVRTGASANKTVLRTDSRSVRILHIAAHSAARERVGENHAIFLSPDSESDGILSYSEIAGLELDCDLVVISGCDAGRPSGTHDWRSLARAFIEAGAMSVVAASWKVEDTMTEQFFSRFYWHVRAGEPVGRALQLTKKTLIREGFRDERIWAGFRLYGKDGSVSFLTKGVEVGGAPGNDPIVVGMGLFILAVLILGIQAIRPRRR